MKLSFKVLLVNHHSVFKKKSSGLGCSVNKPRINVSTDEAFGGPSSTLNKPVQMTTIAEHTYSNMSPLVNHASHLQPCPSVFWSVPSV